MSLVSQGDDKPDWCDLNISVIPKFAAHWKTLGSILGLEEHDIDIISKDNANRSIEGCTEMVRKWLKCVYQPTWGKLDDATVSNS